MSVVLSLQHIHVAKHRVVRHQSTQFPCFNYTSITLEKGGLGFGASGVQKGHGDGFPTWVCEEHLFRNLSLAHMYCNYERESLVETSVLKGAVTAFLLELKRCNQPVDEAAGFSPLLLTVACSYSDPGTPSAHPTPCVKCPPCTSVGGWPCANLLVGP